MVCVLGGASGCAAVSAATVPTSQLHAAIDVVAHEDRAAPGTRVSVLFREGLRNMVLADGDAITADLDAQKGLAVPRNVESYLLVAKGIDHAHVAVALKRGAFPGAPSSTVAIPPPLKLDAPAPKAKVAYAAGHIQVTWSNKDAGATVSAQAYPCAEQRPFRVTTADGPDHGSVSVPIAEALKQKPAAPVCVTVDVTRRATGTIDPALGPSSRIVGERHDYVDVTITP
jgi:hypothetical protein